MAIVNLGLMFAIMVMVALSSARMVLRSVSFATTMVLAFMRIPLMGSVPTMVLAFMGASNSGNKKYEDQENRLVHWVSVALSGELSSR